MDSDTIIDNEEEEFRKTRAPNWTAEEIEPIIMWLECEENYIKTKNATRESWIPDLALQVPSRTAIQVAHKYDSMIQEYKKARNAAQRSKWSLREEDYKDDPDRWEELNKKAKFFFRLDAIYGNRPNITPPLLYDQGPPNCKDSDKEILQHAEKSCSVSTSTVKAQLQDDRKSQVERMKKVKQDSRTTKEEEKVKAPEFLEDTQEGKKRENTGKSEDEKREKKKRRMVEKESPVEKSLNSLSAEQALRVEKGLEFQKEKMKQEYDIRREENKERRRQFKIEMEERHAEREERKEEREIARQKDQEARDINARSFDLQFKALELKLGNNMKK